MERVSERERRRWLADPLVGAVREGRLIEARQLRLVCELVDAYRTVASLPVAGAGRLVRSGAEGTPDVDEFLVKELHPFAGGLGGGRVRPARRRREPPAPASRHLAAGAGRARRGVAGAQGRPGLRRARRRGGRAGGSPDRTGPLGAALRGRHEEAGRPGDRGRPRGGQGARRVGQARSLRLDQAYRQRHVVARRTAVDGGRHHAGSRRRRHRAQAGRGARLRREHPPRPFRGTRLARAPGAGRGRRGRSRDGSLAVAASGGDADRPRGPGRSGARPRHRCGRCGRWRQRWRLRGRRRPRGPRRGAGRARRDRHRPARPAGRAAGPPQRPRPAGPRSGGRRRGRLLRHPRSPADPGGHPRRPLAVPLRDPPGRGLRSRSHRAMGARWAVGPDASFEPGLPRSPRASRQDARRLGGRPGEAWRLRLDQPAGYRYRVTSAGTTRLADRPAPPRGRGPVRRC